MEKNKRRRGPKLATAAHARHLAANTLRRLARKEIAPGEARAVERLLKLWLVANHAAERAARIHTSRIHRAGIGR